MNDLKRRFINRYQGGFPLVEDPFTPVATELGIDSNALITLIRELLDEGLLSRFGPLYDASSMGGSITLAALSVPQESYEQVARLVNDMPEVAHNYQRQHNLNMWFVIATETPEALQQTLARIERSTAGTHS